jgi:hypothetical protein
MTVNTALGRGLTPPGMVSFRATAQAPSPRKTIPASATRPHPTAKKGDTMTGKTCLMAVKGANIALTDSERQAYVSADRFYRVEAMYWIMEVVDGEALGYAYGSIEEAEAKAAELNAAAATQKDEGIIRRESDSWASSETPMTLSSSTPATW